MNIRTELRHDSALIAVIVSIFSAVIGLSFSAGILWRTVDSQGQTIRNTKVELRALKSDHAQVKLNLAHKLQQIQDTQIQLSREIQQTNRKDGDK